jgi:hypothetical protein
MDQFAFKGNATQSDGILWALSNPFIAGFDSGTTITLDLASIDFSLDGRTIGAVSDILDFGVPGSYTFQGEEASARADGAWYWAFGQFTAYVSGQVTIGSDGTYTVNAEIIGGFDETNYDWKDWGVRGVTAELATRIGSIVAGDGGFDTIFSGSNLSVAFDGGIHVKPQPIDGLVFSNDYSVGGGGSSGAGPSPSPAPVINTDGNPDPLHGRGVYNLPPSPSENPLVIDLGPTGLEQEDGLEFFDRFSSAIFYDYDGDEYAERTAWVGPNEGMVAWDKNGNGKIDANEFVLTKGPDSEGKTDLHVILNYFDTDRNGKLSTQELSATREGGRLYIWQDRNLDGVADPEEVQLLTNLVSEIDATGVEFLDPSSADYLDRSKLADTDNDGDLDAIPEVRFRDGSMIYGTAKVTLTTAAGGGTTTAYDMAFAHNEIGIRDADDGTIDFEDGNKALKGTEGADSFDVAVDAHADPKARDWSLTGNGGNDVLRGNDGDDMISGRRRGRQLEQTPLCSPNMATITSTILPTSSLATTRFISTIPIFPVSVATECLRQRNSEKTTSPKRMTTGFCTTGTTGSCFTTMTARAVTTRN